jgi:hypothetical protein
MITAATTTLIQPAEARLIRLPAAGSSAASLADAAADLVIGSNLLLL